MATRRTWADLPDAVRDRVRGVLGGEPVSVRSCTGGFSRSTAEVVTGADGRSLFVKALRREDNPGAWDLNHREAAALETMPAAAPVPALRDAFTHGTWFVLVTDAAPGAVPALPWRADQLDAALAALAELAETATPAPQPDLPSLPDSLGDDMRGFARILADPPRDLDPFWARRLPELVEASERGIAALAGQTLCHSDLRADNMLVTEDGRVSLVDWAWAARGSRFADAVQLLSSVEDRQGRLDVDGRVDRVLDRYGVPRSTGTDVLTGILGFFLDAARFEDGEVSGLQAHRIARCELLAPLVRRRWERAA